MSKEEMQKAFDESESTLHTTDIFNFDEENQELVGIVVDVKPFTGGKFDSEVNQYVIDDGEDIVTCILGTATDKQLTEIDLKGKLVSITFKGKAHLEDGRSVNRFKVRVAKNAP